MLVITILMIIVKNMIINIMEMVIIIMIMITMIHCDSSSHSHNSTAIIDTKVLLHVALLMFWPGYINCKPQSCQR